MNVNALLSEAAPTNMNNRTYEYSATSTPYHNNGSIRTPQSLSPSTECKNVHFRFCNSEPKTLHIYPHDTTDSITTTVKNMFGIKLQDEYGLSFQDPEGRYMILRHENFSDDMTVDIRVEENPASYLQYNLQHPQAMFYTGPGLRGSFSDGRSVSPSAARGRRSASAGGRPRGMKRQASHRGEEEHYDERCPQGYYPQQPPQQFLPEGDEESESRSRIEPVASADISLDNIVEGSRRKRPKFSSDVNDSLGFHLRLICVNLRILFSRSCLCSRPRPSLDKMAPRGHQPALRILHPRSPLLMVIGISTIHTPHHHLHMGSAFQMVANPQTLLGKLGPMGPPYLHLLLLSRLASQMKTLRCN